MGRENGRERRGAEAALSSELTSLKQCLEVTVPLKKWPRIGCLWARLFPTWAHPGGLQVDSWKGMTGPHGSYLGPGLYALQLRHWLKCFPLEQFHIMSSKAFQKETRDEMRGLANFLGLGLRADPGTPDGPPGQAAGSAGEKGKSKAEAGVVVNEKVLESRHRTKKKSTGVKASPISAQTAAALAAFFAPFNEELWVLIGRKVAW
mmetsp:Transcript_68882/g.155817  ORF Transcript_68882/g.155817 Transcript_68882/m.155817 type:complete len:205 (-) Transcript_68882:106-720(-)